MEGFGGTGLDGVNTPVRKKRSIPSRRPRPDSQPFVDSGDHSPPTDSTNNVSSGENAGYNTSFRRKEFSLNASASRFTSINRGEGETIPKRIRKVNEFIGSYSNRSSRAGLSSSNDKGGSRLGFKRCSEGVLAPANWKGTSKVKEESSRNLDSYIENGRNVDSQTSGQSGVAANDLVNRGGSLSHENKLRKVKLKVGGVTRTIHAKSMSNSSIDGGSSMKPSHLPESLIIQENLDSDLLWKDFPRGGYSRRGKEDLRGKMSEGSMTEKQMDKSNAIPFSEPVRKSKRVPKRRVLDGEFEHNNEDDEIRYLERLKTPMVHTDYGAEYEYEGQEDRRKKGTSRVSKSRVGYEEDVEEYGSSRLKESRKKFRLQKFEDTDYMEEEDEEEEEEGSDVGFDSKRKKQRKESIDSLTDGKKEISLTMRQRALQSGKDVSAGISESLVEFPNGLPPTAPRKQKEKLSEVEQQLKKAEVAQRRKMQVEKAARESEAEAIRKILGQDSNRKKKEDKLRKRRDELAQERAANAVILASNAVRWVMGPTGTVVTFSNDVGLPSIFESRPCSYPPPREKCAGPLCMNPYKYRDSKSKLPLCSLQCYQAIQEMMRPVSTC